MFAPASIDPQSITLLLELLSQFRGKDSNFYFHCQRETSYHLEDPGVLLLGMLLVMSNRYIEAFHVICILAFLFKMHKENYVTQHIKFPVRPSLDTSPLLQLLMPMNTLTGQRFFADPLPFLSAGQRAYAATSSELNLY